MSGPKLVVDVESIQRNRHDNVTGAIHLDIDGIQFPTATWRDFPVIILGWWGAALTALMEGNMEVQDLNFMDGPYAVRITPLERDLVQIECCKRRASDASVAHSASLRLPDFVRAYLTAATQVEAYCVNQGWGDSDLQQLRERLAELKQALA